MIFPDKIENIGFISTRLQGTDGVTLETAKWVDVLQNEGYNCYFMAGLSDWDEERTMIVPEAFFDHPAIKEIQSQCFGKSTRSSRLTGDIHHYRMKLKQEIYAFIKKFSIDMLIPENALTIPMNIPLGLAITEIIAETGIPTIAHHHDFYWERQRFMVNCVPDFLAMAFPPVLPSMRHAVINTPADSELSYRTGISAHIIPNILDFHTPAPMIDDFNSDVRERLGLSPDDIFILQPTRIVSRKGIEHSIELVSRLKDPRVKLVITHAAGDEGFEYEQRIREYAEIMNVPLVINAELFGEKRSTDSKGNKIYTLWDAYPHADLVTYPSIYEGFGNAFLEAVYFKKPILVNRYTIYETDIEPRGFEVIAMNGFITDKVVNEVRRYLDNPLAVEQIVENNYKIALKFFSFKVLANKLKAILMDFEGAEENFCGDSV